LAGPQCSIELRACELLNNEPLIAQAKADQATPTSDRLYTLRRQRVEAVRMFSLVDHYRRLANEAGERAQQATDPSLKSTFTELAKGYARLEIAEQKQA
jgi:hypothetical protein